MNGPLGWALAKRQCHPPKPPPEASHGKRNTGVRIMSNHARNWSQTCQRCTSHATFMSSMCRTAAQLIHRVTERFTRQDAPTTGAESSIRQQQWCGWSSMVTLIAHADWMARMVPRAANEVLEEARKFCENSFPETQNQFMQFLEKRTNAAATISRICNRS
jgi:hypothetical protein